MEYGKGEGTSVTFVDTSWKILTSVVPKDSVLLALILCCSDLSGRAALLAGN